MHAGPKSPPVSEEDVQKQAVEEEKLLALFQALCLQRGQKEDEKIVENSFVFLQRVPECYTIYNIRREALAHLFSSDPECTSERLIKEIKWNTTVLKEDYKCYAAFTHRHWIYERLLALAVGEEGTGHMGTHLELIQNLVTKEMKQCELLLELDERNFHAWNYRRWVISLQARVNNISSCIKSTKHDVLTGTDQRDLEFTAKKIDQNFSNYSAWHQRSLVYQRCFLRLDTENEVRGSQETLNEIHNLMKNESNLICQAIYCDPNDQAAWFYAPFVLNLCLTHLWRDEIALTEKKDIVDGFISVVVDLIAEVSVAEHECFLPHSFLLLFFVHLLENSCKTEAAERLNKYLGWIRSRVFKKEGESDETELFHSGMTWLVEYLVRTDSGRQGMYLHLSSRLTALFRKR